MKSDWPKFQVSELEYQGKLLVQDGNHGEYRPRKLEFCDAGIAFIRAADFSGSTVNFREAEKINSTAFNRIRKGIGRDLDTILSTKGTVGKIAFVPKGSPEFVCSPQTSFWRSLDETFLLPDFLYYEMQSSFFVNQILSRQGETDMAAYLSLTSQRSMYIRVPDIGTQKEVVKFLSCIDNKIKIDEDINQTLEQIAQAVFKSWFVDFEPVKAKIAVLKAGGSEEGALLAAMQAISGKGEAELTRLQAGQPEQYAELRATAELFPSAMQDSELGEIPVGWEPAPLSELFELHRGFDLPQKSREEGPYEVYAAGGLHGTHSQYKMEPPGVITGRSGVIGNVYLSLKKYWPLNTTLYIRQFRSCGPYYAYQLLKTLDLKALNSGSAVPSLNRNFVHSIAVLNPGSTVLNKFESLSSSLFEQIVQNIDQSTLLSTLRDTLLPKLLSGELSTSSAEYQLAEAAEAADV